MLTTIALPFIIIGAGKLHYYNKYIVTHKNYLQMLPEAYHNLAGRSSELPRSYKDSKDTDKNIQTYNDAFKYITDQGIIKFERNAKKGNTVYNNYNLASIYNIDFKIEKINTNERFMNILGLIFGTAFFFLIFEYIFYDCLKKDK